MLPNICGHGRCEDRPMGYVCICDAGFKQGPSQVCEGQLHLLCSLRGQAWLTMASCLCLFAFPLLPLRRIILARPLITTWNCVTREIIAFHGLVFEMTFTVQASLPFFLYYVVSSFLTFQFVLPSHNRNANYIIFERAPH